MMPLQEGGRAPGGPVDQHVGGRAFGWSAQVDASQILDLATKPDGELVTGGGEVRERLLDVGSLEPHRHEAPHRRHSPRAIFVAEIGDIGRFDSPKKLCSWAGLTPKHRKSDQSVHRGSITKQGSPLVRWAAIEAVGKYRAQRQREAPDDGYRRIAERRGKYKARVAVARKLLTLVYYGLRDGEVRCLEATPAA